MKIRINEQTAIQLTVIGMREIEAFLQRFHRMYAYNGRVPILALSRYLIEMRDTYIKLGYALVSVDETDSLDGGSYRRALEPNIHYIVIEGNRVRI